jgi:hypothetical protein
MMQNRKGDERILTFYWILVFVIIAVAVASAVILFFGKPLDVREKETEIFADKIVDCYVNQGVIDSGALEIKDSATLRQRCRLSFQDISNRAYADKEQYYVEVKAGNYEMMAGNSDLKPLCDSAESKSRIPVCMEKKIFVLNNEGEFVLLQILTAVRKVEQNAP